MVREDDLGSSGVFFRLQMLFRYDNVDFMCLLSSLKAFGMHCFWLTIAEVQVRATGEAQSPEETGRASLPFPVLCQAHRVP